MIKNRLAWINYIIGSLAIALVAGGFLILLFHSEEIPVSNKPPPKTALPKRAFALPSEAYNLIGAPLLSLQFAPMSQQLPDLSRYLIYYGKNGRPDATTENPLLHFAFTGNKVISSVTPGQKLYILYDRNLHPPQYVFSPDNKETSLWMEAGAQNNEAVVKVSMRGDNGVVLSEPTNRAVFNLPEKEYTRFGGASLWEIGKNRVDATLLARQRARWYGPDVFFAKHGGKEYADFASKQRIDFGEGDEAHSVFVGLNDSLVWVNGRWKSVKPGVDSLGKPMMVVKKIDDRLMNLELWDPEGKGKIALNLLKTSEAASPANVIQQFKFVSARTRTQFVFEINKERILLSPQDWLVLTKDGWIKLATPEQIDDYVERKIIGPMFVFDAVEKRDDKQYLMGTLFNSARTEMYPVEIPLQQSTNAAGSAGRSTNSIKGCSLDDDEDDDDDDDDEDDED